jgi:hypothetical protein
MAVLIAIVALLAFGAGVLAAYLADGDLRGEVGELTT